VASSSGSSSPDPLLGRPGCYTISTAKQLQFLKVVHSFETLVTIYPWMLHYVKW